MPPSSFPTPRLDKLPSELLLFATLDSSSSLSEMPSLVPIVVGNYFSNVFFGIVFVQVGWEEELETTPSREDNKKRET